MSKESRQSSRQKPATGRSSKQQRRVVAEAPESDPHATLSIPGTYSANGRYFFIVNGGGSECTEAVFNFLLEACWARKRFQSGCLYLKDCFTAEESSNYFAKLAGDLRRACGHSRYLVTGPGCYWLLFAAENIALSPRILEMKGLDARVLEKLKTVITSSGN